MNLSDISTQLLYTTMPIWIEQENGDQFSGTSFILSLPAPDGTANQIPLLITNAHVVTNAKRGRVDFVERADDLPKQGARLRVEIPGAALTAHISDKDDLAIIPIAGLLNQLENHGSPAFFRSVSIDLFPKEAIVNELAAMEQITFIGYPSGLYDEHNFTPLIRQGITATPAWNDYQGDPAFLIDAGVFPGSSGSPVFIMNQGSYASKTGITIGSRLLFMGILTESITRTERQLPPVFLGIGKVIKAQRIREFAESVVDVLTTPTTPPNP
jgi:S1-C subfamily serine protease